MSLIKAKPSLSLSEHNNVYFFINPGRKSLERNSSLLIDSCVRVHVHVHACRKKCRILTTEPLMNACTVLIHNFDSSLLCNVFRAEKSCTCRRKFSGFFCEKPLMNAIRFRIFFISPIFYQLVMYVTILCCGDEKHLKPEVGLISANKRTRKAACWWFSICRNIMSPFFF